MAVITIAILVDAGAAPLARIGSIIAIIAHTVDAAPVGQIRAAHAAFRAILILTAKAKPLEAIPIPVGFSAGIAQSGKTGPAGFTDAAYQRIAVSISNAAVIASGKISLILVVIGLRVAAGAVAALGFTAGNRSAAQVAIDHIDSNGSFRLNRGFRQSCVAGCTKAVDHIPGIAGYRATLAIGSAHLDHAVLAQTEIRIELPGSKFFLACKAGYAKFRRLYFCCHCSATAEKQQCYQNKRPETTLFHLTPPKSFHSLCIFYLSKAGKSRKGIAVL
jgi:hypothetical protein